MAALFLLLLIVVLPAYMLGMFGLTFTFSGYRHRLGTLLCGLPIFGLGLLAAWGIAREALWGRSGSEAGVWTWGVIIAGSMLLAGGVVVVRWFRR